MKLFTPLLLCLVVPVICSGATPIAAGTTLRDYDSKANFSSYKTYAWAPLPNTQKVASAEVDKAIRAAVDAGLSAKGFTKVEGKKPDFYAIYHVTSEQKTDVRYYTDWGFGTAYQAGYGFYTGWPTHPATYGAIERYKVGALVLDFVEVRRQQLVWRGVAPGVFGTAQQDAGKATKAVTSMLNQYPPIPVRPAR